MLSTISVTATFVFSEVSALLGINLMVRPFILEVEQHSGNDDHLSNNMGMQLLLRGEIEKTESGLCPAYAAPDERIGGVLVVSPGFIISYYHSGETNPMRSCVWT